MKDITLLIMAAGMGSRFGGLKQIEPVGPNQEFIIDYSVYDAVQSGFTKIVFVIKKENEEIFKETIGKRIEKQIKVEYVFQDINDLPAGIKAPAGRVKPWGTAHAILAAKDKIKEPFAIINSDDFYGRESFVTLAKFLKERATDHNFAMVGYKISNTLTENGSVKRGICEVKNGYLKNITECIVERQEEKIVAQPLDGSNSIELQKDDPVSMNMFGFTPFIFDYITEKMKSFFVTHQKNLDTCEFLIPDVIKDGILEKKIEMEVLPTNAKWQGVTYKEDKPQVVKEIQELIENNVYPQKLWRS